MKVHTFVRSKGNFPGPPDETCDRCGKDPRNACHRQAPALIAKSTRRELLDYVDHLQRELALERARAEGYRARVAEEQKHQRRMFGAIFHQLRRCL